eukprot:4251316-Amphidinium_carterae.1
MHQFLHEKWFEVQPEWQGDLAWCLLQRQHVEAWSDSQTDWQHTVWCLMSTTAFDAVETGSGLAVQSRLIPDKTDKCNSQS